MVFLVGNLSLCPEAWASSADVPLDHWSYEAVERLAARGFCSGLGLGMRPLSRSWMAGRTAEALEAAESDLPGLSQELAYQIEEDLLRLRREFAPELKREGRSGPSFQTHLVSETFVTAFRREESTSLLENSQGFRLHDGFNGRWRLPSWLSVGDWLAVTLDPSVRTRERDSDADLDLEEGSLKLAYRNLELRGGVLNFWWGPGYHGDFLLTNNTRPLRAFSLRTREEFKLPWKLRRLGGWQVQLITAQLEDERTPSNDFLTGTRVEWSPERHLVLGAGHTALVGGEGEEEGLSEFLNAIDPTAGGGETERIDHLFDGDVRFFFPELLRWSRAGTGLEFYAEFFGEDTKGFYIPDMVSYLAGAAIADLFSVPGLDLRAEWAKIHDKAYEHFVHTSGYRFKGEFLGHHAGPDSEELFGRLSKDFSFWEKRFVAGVQAELERRGESGEALSFGEVAQTRKEFQIDLHHEFSEVVEIVLAYQFEDIDNFRGSSGADSNNHIVSAETRLHF